MRWMMRASRGFLAPAAGASAEAGASGFESVVALVVRALGGSEEDAEGFSSESAVEWPFVSAMVGEGGGAVEVKWR